MWENITLVIKFASQLMTLFDKAGTVIKEKKLEAWVTDMQSTIDTLEKAETPEQKRAVARNIVDLIRRL